MSSHRWPATWPPEASAIAGATVAGVNAVVDQDPDALDEAIGRGLDVPQSRVDIVHAAVIRDLLEQTYPDDVTGDDLHSIVSEVVVTDGSWVPDLDPSVLVTVLLGALGVNTEAPVDTDNQDPDDVPALIRPPRESLVRHGFLAIKALGVLADGDVPTSFLRAVGEIERAETVEMP